jgi:magnesium-transporting ATPase (P-type)
MREDYIPVIRGREGYSITVNQNDLVVGDIIYLDEGMKVPADCLLIEGSNISTNEELISDNKELVHKS